MIIVLLFPVMVMEVDNANDEDNNDGIIVVVPII